MKDIRVISAKYSLKVQSVAPIRGFLPPSIIVLGSELNRATEVYYNDIQAKEFLIQSPSRLIVKIPPEAIGKNFTSIRVLASAAVSKRDASISFQLNNPLERISGIDRLIQNYLMVLMTTPGSDVFDKSSGGGAQALIGRPTDRYGKGVSADLASSLERTKTEIIKKQSKGTSIPLSEKLLNATLDQIVFDSSVGRLTAIVTIQNMLGDQAEISVR